MEHMLYRERQTINKFNVYMLYNDDDQEKHKTGKGMGTDILDWLRKASLQWHM